MFFKIRNFLCATDEYCNDPIEGARNENGSPIVETLNLRDEFGIWEICLGVILNGFHISKTE